MLVFLAIKRIDVVVISGYGFPRWRGGASFMGSENMSCEK